MPSERARERLVPRAASGSVFSVAMADAASKKGDAKKGEGVCAPTTLSSRRALCGSVSGKLTCPPFGRARNSLRTCTSWSIVCVGPSRFQGLYAPLLRHTCEKPRVVFRHERVCFRVTRVLTRQLSGQHDTIPHCLMARGSAPPRQPLCSYLLTVTPFPAWPTSLLCRGCSSRD